MSSVPFVIGTAGHIDHGKTTLVRALTGVDLDRLPEERERGITIALGFTHLELAPGRILSFVDVPGHERLVRTMISGATGLDAVMLCVSAVEGVMPQTREHLAILGLLGLKVGLVALTMCDLVDEEMRELAQLDVEEAVAGTFLEGAPVIETAALPEAPQGLDALKAQLAALPTRPQSSAGSFRLPVDRAFVQRGFGTVVTGTLRSGSVQDGDEVRVEPAGLDTRIRGIQVHGQKVDRAVAGQRTALNLAGIERDDLARGMVVVHPGKIPPASVLDARYRHLDGAPPLEEGARVRLLTGTAEVMAVATLVDHDGPDPEVLGPGGRGHIQLRTERPLTALPGDRFVLRRASPMDTLGGGTLLDPWSKRVRRADRGRAAVQLRALDQGDRSVFLLRAGDLGLDARERALVEAPEGVLLGDRHLHPDRAQAMGERLISALDGWHADHPLVPGAPRRDLHRRTLAHVSGRVFDALVARACADGTVVADGPTLRRRGFAVQPNAQQQATMKTLLAKARAAGLEGPKLAELLVGGADETHLLIRQGRLHKVGERVLHDKVLQGLAAQVLEHIDQHGQIDAQGFKALTGLSRRHAIPLLEWLDGAGHTRRSGDHRVRA